MMQKLFFILIGIFSLLIFSVEAHSCVSPHTQKKVKPYLIPKNHPIKLKLDQLFSSSRAILSIKHLKKAGFESPKVRKWTHIVVTKHPDFPGYIFKTYLDAQRHFKDMPEHDHWIKRIQGVRAVQRVINENHLGEIFKTPKKWIYELPNEPAPPKEFIRKNYILVEEDMNLCSKITNERHWKSTRVTKETLDGLFLILKTVGLSDCAKRDNLPFSLDGKIAFIDTESCEQWPVPYKRLTSSLPKNLQSYWLKLIENDNS